LANEHPLSGAAARVHTFFRPDGAKVVPVWATLQCDATVCAHHNTLVERLCIVRHVAYARPWSGRLKLEMNRSNQH
jgi:hypothetical protein